MKESPVISVQLTKKNFRSLYEKQDPEFQYKFDGFNDFKFLAEIESLVSG